MTAESSVEYLERVNLAIDYVVQHLDQRVVLDDVARVAGFSPFHFHRIFRSLVGETLKQFVRRLRIERALHMMSHQPQLTLTQVALGSGFSSSSDFTRCFKQRYGLPPSAFDIDTFRKKNRESFEAMAHGAGNPHALKRLPPGENPDGFEVTLRDLPARTVAYIRVPDPYQPGPVVQAAHRLLAWAELNGVADRQWLGYMWDDPEIVALPDCRYDVGVEVDDLVPSGEIGRIAFPTMLVAQVEVRGGIDLEMRALDWLWGTWLPRSSYVPTDQPSFEAWIGRPFAHGEAHFEINVQLPVQAGRAGAARS